MAARYAPSMSGDILFTVEGVVGRNTLNRPRALNALTLPMCEAMLERLESWAGADGIKCVVIDAVPGRAFCAGGDMRAILESVMAKDGKAREFFAAEYRMNAAIRRFLKPYVALIDGIVMGGGAGSSVHGSHRVVTENTVFAMPETALGFFPDVGASYFLSRLPGALGMYLGLTGVRIDAADMVYAGLATHFVPASQLGDIVPRLSRGEKIDAVLWGRGGRPDPSSLETHRAAIDRAFSAPSVEQIVQALESEGEWGAETTQLLATRSPTSLKLVYRQLKEGKTRNFASCLDTEYAIASRILNTHDFREGVRAVLIDKDQRPNWHPAGLADVSDEAIAGFFTPGISLFHEKPAPK